MLKLLHSPLRERLPKMGDGEECAVLLGLAAGQFSEFEKWQSTERLDENTGGLGRTLQS
jgi:hypothetical protein